MMELVLKSPHPPVGTFSHAEEGTGEGNLRDTFQFLPSPVLRSKMGEGADRRMRAL